MASLAVSADVRQKLPCLNVVEVTVTTRNPQLERVVVATSAEFFAFVVGFNDDELTVACRLCQCFVP